MLEDTVQSLLACEAEPLMPLQIIVVDNGSTDDTSKRMARYASAGSIETFVETTPGLSNARNAGVRRAIGDWLLFLDDDVLLPVDFLRRYYCAMRALDHCAFLAGPVRPCFDVAIAPWVGIVLERLPWAFSALDLGEPRRDLEPDQFPFGANMAMRADVAHQFPFSPDRGFRHGSMVPGEETALFRSIVAAGYRGGWVPDVPVRHRMPPERAATTFLMKRAFGQGRAEAADARDAGERSWWVSAELPRLLIAFVWHLARGRSDAGAIGIHTLRRLGHLWELATRARA